MLTSINCSISMGSGHNGAEVRNRRIFIFLGVSFSSIWLRDERILNVMDEVTEEEISQIGRDKEVHRQSVVDERRR